NGTGLQFNNADGAYAFGLLSGTTTLSGGDAGVDIVNGSAGSFTFGGGTAPGAFAITNPTGAAFLVSTGAPGVLYSGLITQNTAAQRLISVSDTTGGSVTFNSPT